VRKPSALTHRAGDIFWEPFARGFRHPAGARSVAELAALGSGWQLKLTGWPWWVVLLLAMAGVWALVRLHRRELAALDRKVRRRLLWLRGATLALLILFLMEPSLTRTTTERVLPLVAVVIDQSGSMAVKDESMAPGAKLAEAIGLKLLPASVRPLKTNAIEQAASIRRSWPARRKVRP